MIQQPEELLKRLDQDGNPVIDGSLVIFCWRGERPPDLIADFTNWDEDAPLPLEPVGDRLWAYWQEFPVDSYIEYGFVRNGRRIADPLNPSRTPNGMGKTNHYFQMPEVQTNPWLRSGEPILGKITSHLLDTGHLLAGRQRIVHFYTPPVKKPVPLLVVLDGQDYLKRAQIPVMVDRMIAAGRIQPVALALVENVSRYRTMEYTCSEAHIGFLKYILVPYAMEHFNLVNPARQPGSWGICGASYGGLMALYAGLRIPSIFGKVLSQSGGFSIPEHEFVVWDLVRNREALPLKIWLDCGRYEQLVDANRTMAALLRHKNYHVEYVEYNGGHNYPSWRNHLWLGLEYLYGA